MVFAWPGLERRQWREMEKNQFNRYYLGVCTCSQAASEGELIREKVLNSLSYNINHIASGPSDPKILPNLMILWFGME